MFAVVAIVLVTGGAIAGLVVGRAHAKPTHILCVAGLCPKFPVGKPAQLEATDPVFGKVRLFVPAGALATGTELSIAPAPPGTRPPRIVDPENEVDPTIVGPVIDFGPDGQTFTTPLRLELPFDPTKVPAGRSVGAITWDEHHAERLVPRSFDPATGVMVVDVAHFSNVAAVVDPGPQVIFVGTEPSPRATELLGPTINTEPSSDCTSGMARVRAAVEHGDYRVYTDTNRFYAEQGIFPHERTMLWYLYAEDGGAMSSVVTGADQPIKPIRSGREGEFLHLLKDAIKTKVKLDPDAVLDLALRAVRHDDGSANLAEAAVTAHNVIRALARSDKWLGEMIDPHGRPCPPDFKNCGIKGNEGRIYGHPPSDPLVPVLRDLIGAESIDGSPTMWELLGGKPGHPPENGVLMGAFAPGTGVFSTMPGVGDEANATIHNGGSHYYYWTGAIGQLFHGAAPTTAGMLVELVLTKLPSNDPRAGLIQSPNLMRGRGDASCLESTPPVPPAPPAPPEPPPCPELPRTAVKCPWTPDGFSVGECTPGFCWDGGPQGFLACKEQETPPGSARGENMNVYCPSGVPVRDRCTGVLTSCETPSAPATPTSP